MSGSAVIGALHVVLDADNDNFDGAIDHTKAKIGELEGALDAMGDKLREVGQKVAAVGAGMSAVFTGTFAVMSHSAVGAAATMESAMNRVRMALGSVSPDQLKALETQARSMGPAVGQSAADAAAGIEGLAGKGLAASDILGGAFAASLKLAAVGQTDLAPATELTAGVMQKFGVTAGALGPVVDRITGALNAGHGGLTAYKSAVDEAGDQAVASGVRFEDFNAVIAGTGLVLQKGESAGSAFKAFLSGIQSPSDQAKKDMGELKLSLTGAHGAAKSMADIAGILHDKFMGLSEAARTKAFTDMFGADGMTTAITLMRLGKQGFLDLQSTIDKADASKQAAIAQDGYAAAVKRLSAAWNELKISIGQSGLLNIATSFINTLTRLVTWLDSFSPAAKRMASAFAGIAAAAGPLLAVIGGALYFAFGVFLRTLGPVGWAISAIIEPIGTLIAAGLRFVMWGASRGAIAALGETLLDLGGPIGWAIAAIIAFKDYIVTALEQIWQSMSERLGPPLTALFAKVQALFASLGSGPIGAVFSVLVKIVEVLVDVLGTTLAGALELAGEIIVRVLGAVIDVLGGIVAAVTDGVRLIGDLLTGDFAGAWNDAKQLIGDTCDSIADAVSALVPEIAGSVRGAFNAAKAWLVDGFAWIGDALSGAVSSMVDYVASAFPNVVAAARDVYEGVKGWLVDKFSTILSWIGTAAGWISDKFSSIKEALGLGGPGIVANTPEPKKPVTAPRPSGAVTNTWAPSAKKKDDDDDKKKEHGPTPEELTLQKEIEAATLLGDVGHARALQDALDLSKQIRAYEKAGLSNADARTRAERDMNAITAARSVQDAKAVTEQQRSLAIDIAKLDHNVLLEESLSRQAELQQRIDFFKSKGMTQPAAEAAARKEQDALDAARERVRERWFTDDADARALRLAQLRGDSDEEIRQLQRVIDVKKRARELEDEHVDPDSARAQANKEADQEHAADLQSKFRDIFKGGFKAAMDGDLGDWFKNWWKDKVAKGMEAALNSLADLIANLFSKAGQGSSSSGGLLGTIFGSLFGHKGSGTDAASGDTSPVTVGALDMTDVTPFATGGSFTVGGKSGIDRNLVSMRLSRGEMVDIRKPGNDNGGGGGGTTVHQTIQYSGAVDVADKTFVVQMADAARRAAMQGVAEAKRRSSNG